MILAVFDLQVASMLPTKFQVNWLLSSGEEAKNKMAAILDPIGTILAFLWSSSHSFASYPICQLLVNWPFSSGEEAKN